MSTLLQVVVALGVSALIINLFEQRAHLALDYSRPSVRAFSFMEWGLHTFFEDFNI